MTTLFDGLASALSDVFGETVILMSSICGRQEIQSIFRETPIEIEGSDGNIVRIEAPTWRVRRDLARHVRRGDQVEIADGRVFQIMVVHPSGTPAVDAFLICELQQAFLT